MRAREQFYWYEFFCTFYASTTNINDKVIKPININFKSLNYILNIQMSYKLKQFINKLPTRNSLKKKPLKYLNTNKKLFVRR